MAPRVVRARWEIGARREQREERICCCAFCFEMRVRENRCGSNEQLRATHHDGQLMQVATRRVFALVWGNIMIEHRGAVRGTRANMQMCGACAHRTLCIFCSRELVGYNLGSVVLACVFFDFV